VLAQDLVSTDIAVDGVDLEEDHGSLGLEIMERAPAPLALSHDREGGDLSPARG
jgi:hypothetical protein